VGVENAERVYRRGALGAPGTQQKKLKSSVFLHYILYCKHTRTLTFENVCQTHFVRARTDELWYKTNPDALPPGAEVRGQVWFSSAVHKANITPRVPGGRRSRSQPSIPGPPVASSQDVVIAKSVDGARNEGALAKSVDGAGNEDVASAPTYSAGTSPPRRPSPR
jgi:hypothetical protein